MKLMMKLMMKSMLIFYDVVDVDIVVDVFDEIHINNTFKYKL